MSAVADLEVENFKKKAKEAQDAITQLEKQLLDLRKEKLTLSDKGELAKNKADIQQTTLALKEQRIALRESNVQLKERTQALKTAGTAQQQFRSQVGASNAVALEFNRIIQDAPFGIIGIGNNIQQLASQFSVLRASAGGTGAALKASLQSLVSPVNLALIGVSALTSLWTAYQLGVFDSAEATKEFVSESQKLAESLSNVEKNLGAIERARLNSAKSAQEELIKVSLLKDVIEDINRPLSERTKAYESLVEVQPDIIKYTTQEKALANGLGDAYLKVVDAITQRATAVAIEEELVRIAKEKLTLLKRESQETDLQIKLENQRIKLINERNKITGPLSIATAAGPAITEAGQRFRELTNEIERVQTEIQLLGNTLAVDTTNALQQNESDTKRLADQWKSLNLEFAGIIGTLKEVDKEQGVFYGGIELTRKSIADLVTELEGYYDVLQLIKTQNYEEVISPPITSIARGSQEQEFKRNMGLSDSIKKMGDETKKTTMEIQKLYATEALGGNPFAFLIDSIFKFQEVKGSLDDFADGSVEKMALLREQAVLTGNIFSGLGDTFASVFASGNRELGQFISALGDFVGQLLVFAKAQQQASALVVGAKQAEATAAGISAGAQTAASFGPKSFFVLAPLIASAVALVGSAFRGLGGAKNRGVSRSAGASASLNSVGSSITGFGASANPFGDLTLRTSIRGTDIELLLERVTTKSRA